LCADGSVQSLAVRTLPDSTPPQPDGEVSTVSESSFTFKYTQDEPGVAYYVLLVPAEQDRYKEVVQPGELIAQVLAGDLKQGPASTSSVLLFHLYTTVLVLHVMPDKPCLVQLHPCSECHLLQCHALTRLLTLWLRRNRILSWPLPVWICAATHSSSHICMKN
jgi:hypothetical protein